MSSNNAMVWPSKSNDQLPTDPANINLTAVRGYDDLATQVICYLDSQSEGYNGSLGARISSIFVILIVSLAGILFPVVATRSRRIRIPLYLYLFVRYFGTGVIIATAFIHLLDPAYQEIGPQSCIGRRSGWREYSWPPAIALSASFVAFLIDFTVERHVDRKYGLAYMTTDERARRNERKRRPTAKYIPWSHAPELSQLNPAETHDWVNEPRPGENPESAPRAVDWTTFINAQPTAQTSASPTLQEKDDQSEATQKEDLDRLIDLVYKQQIGSFLILEIGVLFHNVVFGLALGAAGKHFATLYAVTVFLQLFEGLGVGARLSSIRFPKRLSWLVWFLCAAYGITMPIAIAAAVGVRQFYDPDDASTSIAAGILYSIAAGVLLHVGLVEMLARDFLFNPDRTDSDKQLLFMTISMLLGAGLTALLVKWV